MFDKSTDHGNDVMVAQFVFLFLLRKIFAVKPAVCGFSWVLNILTSFLWPIRVQTRENKLLMSIILLISCQARTLHAYLPNWQLPRQFIFLVSS